MPENFPEILLWSGLLALVAGVVACVIVVVRYKRKLRSPIYPMNKYASLSLNVCQDNFLGSTVTRVKISSNKKR